MEKRKNIGRALAVLASLSLGAESARAQVSNAPVDPIITQTMNLIKEHAQEKQEGFMIRKHIAEIQQMQRLAHTSERKQELARYIQGVRQFPQMRRQVLEHNPINPICAELREENRDIAFGGNVSSHSGVLRMFEIDVSQPGLVTLTETIRKKIEAGIHVTRRTKTWNRAEFQEGIDGGLWFHQMDKITPEFLPKASLQLQADIKKIEHNCGESSKK